MSWRDTCRTERTFSVGTMEQIPWLPRRVQINEFKDYGMVNLYHAKRPGAVPWLEPIWNGRLYVVCVTNSTPKGVQQCAWLYRPIIRVPARVGGLA
jgi:hypothetical protein